MSKYDLSTVSREALEQLAELALTITTTEEEEFEVATDRIRRQARKLPETPAEILAEVRRIFKTGTDLYVGCNDDQADYLSGLLGIPRRSPD